MSVNYFPYSGQAEDTAGVPEDWALQQGGIDERFFQRDIPIGAADGNGSNYCIMQGIPASAILTELKAEIDANASFTQASVGLYDSDTGVAIAVGCFANNVNVAAGSTKNAPFDMMAALTHSQTAQRMKDIAIANGGVNKGRYDLVLTCPTASNAAIVASFRGRIINSQ